MKSAVALPGILALFALVLLEANRTTNLMGRFAAPMLAPATVPATGARAGSGAVPPLDWSMRCSALDLDAVRRKHEKRLSASAAAARRQRRNHNIIMLLTADSGHEAQPGELPAAPSILPELYQCALEAAALANPGMNVTLFIRGEAPPLAQRFPHDNPGLRWLASLPNVHIRWTGTDQAFFERAAGSLPAWWRDGAWRRDVHLASHLSDAMRWQLLWDAGGIWSDLDAVFAKPIPPAWLGRTFAVSNGYFGQLGCGVVGDYRHGALTNNILRRFSVEYDPDGWGSVGPALLTKVFGSLPEDTTYRPPWWRIMPLTWGADKWNNVLKMKGAPREESAVAEAVEDAVSVHFFSSAWMGPAHGDDTSIAGILKVNRCPITACSAEPSTRALFGNATAHVWKTLNIYT